MLEVKKIKDCDFHPPSVSRPLQTCKRLSMLFVMFFKKSSAKSSFSLKTTKRWKLIKLVEISGS